jgi:hypothetical protein
LLFGSGFLLGEEEGKKRLPGHKQGRFYFQLSTHRALRDCLVFMFLHACLASKSISNIKKKSGHCNFNHRFNSTTLGPSTSLDLSLPIQKMSVLADELSKEF